MTAIRSANERLSPLALLATSTDTITANTTPPIPRFNQAVSYLSPTGTACA